MARPKFLIADDSEGKQMLLQGLLRHSHWNVELLVAYSTEEANNLINEHPDIAFAFIDYNIPSENGPAVMRSLREKSPQARIALITSMDSATCFAEAKQAGAEACICTAYQRDDVERTISELIDQWRDK
ncbi:response regulator [Candidatus Peribacteria bacterium]|nr:response regulator [Candidatus Peribacteria bacterium]